MKHAAWFPAFAAQLRAAIALSVKSGAGLTLAEVGEVIEDFDRDPEGATERLAVRLLDLATRV